MVRIKTCVWLAGWLFLYSTSHGQILELNPVDELPAPKTAVEEVAAEALTDEVDPPVAPQPLISLDAAEAEPAAPDANAQDEPAADEPVREVQGDPLSRGPIHEAFAEPLELTPKPTKVLKQAPPEPISEIAPDTKPDGKNMEWISGYWAWDEQRDDYIWVSGVWRKAPTGRSWVAGRWQQVDNGHQWIAGAWLKSNNDGTVARKVQPAPPPSLEEGPTSPAPSEDHFWIPGTWKYSETNEYAWRAGFWSQSHTNWVWVPDHYTWSPDGCCYVPGYWDYPWERRGTLYAPCTFNGNVNRTVRYRPSRVIDTRQWLVNLWVGPQYGHYYFGDYYGQATQSYQPWYSYYGSNRNCYDPFYSYYRWRFPSIYGIGLYGYLDGLHGYYRNNAAFRPSVSHYRFNDWYGRSRGYNSLYGDVRNLYGRLGYGNYNDRYRNRDGYRRDYLYGYGAGYRGYGYTKIKRQPKPEPRRLIGYANGQALYSDQVGKGTRGEMGLGGRYDSKGNRTSSQRELNRERDEARKREREERAWPKIQPQTAKNDRPRDRDDGGPPARRQTPDQSRLSQQRQNQQNGRPPNVRQRLTNNTPPSQTRQNQTRPSQTARNQTRPNQTRPSQTSRNQTRPNQTQPSQRGNQSPRPGQTVRNQTRPTPTPRPSQTSRPNRTPSVSRLSTPSSSNRTFTGPPNVRQQRLSQPSISRPAPRVSQPTRRPSPQPRVSQPTRRSSPQPRVSQPARVSRPAPRPQPSRPQIARPSPARSSSARSSSARSSSARSSSPSRSSSSSRSSDLMQKRMNIRGGR